VKKTIFRSLKYSWNSIQIWSLFHFCSSGSTTFFLPPRRFSQQLTFPSRNLFTSATPLSVVEIKRRFHTSKLTSLKMPTLRLGDIVPDFTADTTEGEIRFHDWLQDSWAIFFRWPFNFLKRYFENFLQYSYDRS
jgi:hypothetical protein